MTWQPGKYNNSDLGTKVLGKARFQELVEMCGLKPLNGGPGKVHQVRTTPAEGSVLTPAQAGQILTMVTWLSQVAGAKSDPDLDRSNDADYILLVDASDRLWSWMDIGMDLVMVPIHQVPSKR